MKQVGRCIPAPDSSILLRLLDLLLLLFGSDGDYGQRVRTAQGIRDAVISIEFEQLDEELLPTLFRRQSECQSQMFAGCHRPMALSQDHGHRSRQTSHH